MIKREQRRLLGVFSARLPEVGTRRVTDPRRAKSVRQPLGPMLDTILVAMAAGARSLADLERFTELLGPAARSTLGLRGRLPDTTVRNVLVELEPEEAGESLEPPPASSLGRRERVSPHLRYRLRRGRPPMDRSRSSRRARHRHPSPHRLLPARLLPSGHAAFRGATVPALEGPPHAHLRRDGGRHHRRRKWPETQTRGSRPNSLKRALLRQAGAGCHDISIRGTPPSDQSAGHGKGGVCSRVFTVRSHSMQERRWRSSRPMVDLAWGLRHPR